MWVLGGGTCVAKESLRPVRGNLWTDGSTRLTRLLRNSVHAATRKVRVSMKVTTMRRSGFTLVEIMIVVAIIGLLAAIAIPNFVKARTASQRNACIANLKQIEGAKSTWALENKKTGGDQPGDPDLFGADKYIAKKPECPAGGAYQINNVDTPPGCDKNAPPDNHILP